MVPNGRMTDEMERICKEAVMVCGTILAIPGATEENHENLQLGQPMSYMRFTPCTS
jgi:hypothetical protein